MPVLTITKTYTCESAHFLPYVHDTHKCKRMHGHSYKFEIEIAGTLNDNGFIIDFWDLDKVVAPIIETIDHRALNDIEGLHNPTAENIAVWLAGKINAAKGGEHQFKVRAVKVYEQPDCWATVSY